MKNKIFKNIIIIILILSIFNIILADTEININTNNLNSKTNSNTDESENFFIRTFRKSTEQSFEKLSPGFANCFIGYCAAFPFTFTALSGTMCLVLNWMQTDAFSLSIFAVFIIFSQIMGYFYFNSPREYYKTKNGNIINTRKNIKYRYAGYLIPTFDALIFVGVFLGGYIFGQ